jgi:MarR family transcriptional regulator, lower aerobic nicotinate degradation pathway regulator
MSASPTHVESAPATCLLIAQLARGMRRQVEAAAAPLGLRARELLALQHLRDRGPAAQQTLVELVGVDATNLVAILNNLEDAELIKRRRDRADRRRAIIELSAQGEQVLAELDHSLQRLDNALLVGLTPPEREQLSTLLARVVEQTGAACVAPTTEEC